MIPYILAVLACCLAGGLGGYILARPREALTLRGLTGVEGGQGHLSAARGFGAMLLLAHGGTAGLLGYYPSVGASMALALSLLWAGSALGRLVSTVMDGPGDALAIQTLVVEVMISLALSLPFWVSRQLVSGPTLHV